MDNTILIAFITTVGVALATTIGNIIVMLIKHRQERSDKNDEIREELEKQSEQLETLIVETKQYGKVAKGLQCVLRDRIEHLAKRYIEKGEIHAEDLEALIEMHDSYKDLGGNGYLDTLMTAVKALTIVR